MRCPHRGFSNDSVGNGHSLAVISSAWVETFFKSSLPISRRLSSVGSGATMLRESVLPLHLYIWPKSHPPPSEARPSHRRTFSHCCRPSSPRLSFSVPTTLLESRRICLTNSRWEFKPYPLAFSSPSPSSSPNHLNGSRPKIAWTKRGNRFDESAASRTPWSTTNFGSSK